MDLNNSHIDISVLEKYELDGLLYKKKHSELPLYIWNYTRLCQYNNKWDKITKMCRALVTDLDGNIVAKSFPKFFNMNQQGVNKIPQEPFEVYEKLDGSLIIAFYYKDQWVIASKGTFKSDVSILASDYFYKIKYDKYLDRNLTFVFEYVGKKNKHVVDYEFEEKLIIIGLFDKDTEIDINLLRPNKNFNVVKKYDGVSDYKNITELYEGKNREGFVIKFDSGFRVKIKYKDYIRLHRIVTNITTYDIWDHLKNDKNIEELLDKIPDEYDGWVKNVIIELNNKFIEYRKEIDNEFLKIIDNENITDKINKSNYKHFIYAKLNTHSSILNKMIWARIKPKYKKPTVNYEI